MSLGERGKMTEKEIGSVWLHAERAYAVVTADGVMPRPGAAGLSHAQAMRLAEELRRKGHVATVLHVVGKKSYEVDRYPAR
jgi:hypothetical protein